jgi:hypothetical protein
VGNDHFATRVYVVGEVLVSLVVLVGGFLLVFYSPEQAAQLVGAGALGSATAFWFQRRSSEQSNNTTKEVLSQTMVQLHEQQEAQRSSIEAIVATLPRRL